MSEKGMPTIESCVQVSYPNGEKDFNAVEVIEINRDEDGCINCPVRTDYHTCRLAGIDCSFSYREPMDKDNPCPAIESHILVRLSAAVRREVDT